MKRRDFLKTAGLCAASLTVLPPLATLSDAATPSTFTLSDKSLTAKRWAMVIDTRKLTSSSLLQKITEACHAWHNVPKFTGPQEVKWIWTDSFSAAFPEQTTDLPANTLAKRSFLLLCNHCENPPCVRVCPTKATFKRKDGIVVMDYHRCIGCRSCMSGCPYGARSFNFMDPQPYVASPNREYPMRTRGVVEKCSFCVERLNKGKDPLCVEVADGAILFGDLANPLSPVRKTLENNIAVRRKPSLGTGPGVYYIL